MAQNTVSTGFSMYNPRRLERVSFGAFQGAGIDQFTDPVAQNPNNFLNLTNVMPTISGAFQRRWGLSQQGSALSRTTNYARMFNYSAAADTSFAGTQDTALLLATDNVNTDIIYKEIAGSYFSITGFDGRGTIYAATSRDWFYMCDGINQPQKIDYSQVTSDTNERWGIPAPGGTTIDGITYLNVSAPTGVSSGGVGTGYTTTPTLTITGGGGTGATATISLTSGSTSLSSENIIITNSGSGYSSNPTVTVTGGGGTGAFFTGIASPTSGTIIGIVMSGNITIASGRVYAAALQNSITGHVSDFLYSNSNASYPVYGALYLGTIDGNFPDIQLNLGVQSLTVNLSIPVSSVDAQVDTVVLMATSDGGDVEHLYQVALIPLSSFTVSGSNYIYSYQDTFPDTYNDVYSSGPTLLTQNLWVDVDQNGNVIGIADNTPPQNTLNKPVLNQGRMFMTDGKSLYFSKSIDEVTTSTGLITSKWEEAWPGTNELDIAYDNEEITSLLSDGEIVYIGTTDNIYRLLGNNASNFSIPSTIFRGVGVESQDLWSVIYKDNIPAGYMWVTPDYKIMISDFNTYTEIGKPIYPLLTSLGTVTHIQSISYGPYSFAFLSVQTNAGPTYLIYDTKNGGWYLWNRALGITSHTLPPNPIFAYTQLSGIQRLYSVVSGWNAGFTDYLQYFDPASFQDVAIVNNSLTDIPWFIETSWINLQDTASDVVLNELELWSDDPNINVSVYRAMVSADFNSPILVKSGTPVTTPFGNKFQLAGSRSFGRFHKAQFFTNSSTGLSTVPTVLRQFQFELFPQARS